MEQAEQFAAFRRQKEVQAFSPVETREEFESEPLQTRSGSAWDKIYISFSESGSDTYEFGTPELLLRVGEIIMLDVDRSRIQEKSEKISATDDLKLKSDFSELVERARSHGLHEIADRLLELREAPIDQDEIPLQTTSAQRFVDYCIGRRIRHRPLMTVTPTGELDTTWKSEAGETIIARFFLRVRCGLPICLAAR